MTTRPPAPPPITAGKGTPADDDVAGVSATAAVPSGDRVEVTVTSLLVDTEPDADLVTDDALATLILDGESVPLTLRLLLALTTPPNCGVVLAEADADTDTDTDPDVDTEPDTDPEVEREGEVVALGVPLPEMDLLVDLLVPRLGVALPLLDLLGVLVLLEDRDSDSDADSEVLCVADVLSLTLLVSEGESDPLAVGEGVSEALVVGDGACGDTVTVLETDPEPDVVPDTDADTDCVMVTEPELDPDLDKVADFVGDPETLAVGDTRGVREGELGVGESMGIGVPPRATHTFMATVAVVMDTLPEARTMEVA